VGALALGVQALFWKEFKLLTFDREFGGSLGFSVRLLDVLMITLLVLAIVIGLQAVGVVLMSAMIVAPAVAARQWTDRLGVMVTLSACFGALAGVSGAVISSTMVKLSTGPTVVLCISAIVAFSLLFAPNRGLIVNRLRQQRNRRQLRLEAILLDLYSLAVQHADREHAHTIDTLRTMSANQVDVERSLERLAERGLAIQVATGAWALTPQGVSEAEKIAQNTSQTWATATDGDTP
jgi:manganese/zinc/iron transport system permease protein